MELHWKTLTGRQFVDQQRPTANNSIDFIQSSVLKIYENRFKWLFDYNYYT